MSDNFLDAVRMLSSLEFEYQYDNLSIGIDIINIYLFNRDEILDAHSHANYELHYIYQGEGTLILDGKSYSLKKGSFYMTGPGILHKQTASALNPMVEYALRCNLKIKSPSDIQDEKNSLGELTYVLDILNGTSPNVYHNCDHFQNLFECIFTEIIEKQPGYLMKIKNTITDIIIETARTLKSETTVKYAVPKRNINKHRMNLINYYIASNYNRNISCAELAKHIFVSPRQLRRIVETEQGYSVHALITNFRIEAVKHLLTHHKEFTLREIAEQTGFSSEFHLSTVFKKIVGLTPSKFRN